MFCNAGGLISKWVTLSINVWQTILSLINSLLWVCFALIDQLCETHVLPMRPMSFLWDPCPSYEIHVLPMRPMSFLWDPCPYYETHVLPMRPMSSLTCNIKKLFINLPCFNKIWDLCVLGLVQKLFIVLICFSWRQMLVPFHENHPTSCDHRCLPIS